MPNPDRSGRIGPSEIAVLFGLSPYKSLYQLWHEKAGNIEPEDLSNNLYVQYGKIMQEPICHWFCEKNGLAPTVYFKEGDILHDPTISGLAGTPDYYVEIADVDKISPEMEVFLKSGEGVLEVKTTGQESYKKWKHDGPPMSYQLQLQTYMGLSNLKWGALAIAADRELLQPFVYEFKPQAYEAIKKAVADFWQSIKDGKEPDPTDSDKMQPFIRKLLTDDVVDLSSDNKLSNLIEEYKKNEALFATSIKPEYHSAIVKKAILRGEIQKYLFDQKIGSKKITVNGTQINTRFVKECTIKRKASQYIIINNEGITENE